MNVQGFSRVVLVSAVAVMMSACGTLGDNDSRLRAPNYASPVGIDAWRVSCGVNKVYVDHDSLEQFYKDDGTRKTYLEFCDEVNRGGIRTRNQR